MKTLGSTYFAVDEAHEAGADARAHAAHAIEVVLERARLHGGGEQEEQRVEVAERGRLALVADEADQLAEGERADELRQVVEQLEEAAVEEAAAEEPQQAPEEGRLPVGAPVAELMD